MHFPISVLYIYLDLTNKETIMASDFDKTVKGIFHSVKSTFNPDFAIPKEQEGEPMNVRIQRMKDSASEISAKIEELKNSLSAFTTNLNALTEEVQPYLSKEKESSQQAAPAQPAPSDAGSETKAADAAKPADDKPAEDKPADDKPADDKK